MGTISNIEIADEELSDIREDQLSVVLTNDMNEMDSKWLNVENEESQVKLDISDLLLDELCFEVADILNLCSTNK